ncbi:tRNA-intron lyase [Methanococcoides sp. SA1]|nr:tRNA-intron lyase [Methanococcoides sp. SA1]
MQKITATLIGNQVTSNDSQAHALFQKSKFGEKSGQKIIYSLTETLYLTEKNKMQVLDFRNSPLSKNQLLKKFSRTNKDFPTKYTTFKDLREKGYIPKTALKFGADFRVYDKEKRKNSHSKWLCFTTPESFKTTWQDFAAKNRVAHSAKKNILLAIVDEENQITYYETTWVRP